MSVFDVAIVLGFGAVRVAEDTGGKYRLVAGELALRELPTHLVIKKDPLLVSIASLLKTMSNVRSMARGDTFEAICYYSFMVKQRMRMSKQLSSSTVSKVRVSEVFPFLGRTSLAMTLPVDCINEVQLPKYEAVSAGYMISDLLKLPNGTMARPKEASRSQDWFVRLSAGVLGFANKAVRKANGISWAAVRDELEKVPTRSTLWPPEEVFVLVLLTTHWSRVLESLLGDKELLCLSTGDWAFDPSTKAMIRSDFGTPTLRVPPNTELVLANPNAIGGGPLGQIVGEPRLLEIRQIIESASPAASPRSASS
jgi:hypothetical protein